MSVIDGIFPLAPTAKDAAAAASHRGRLTVVTCMDPRVDPGALLPHRGATALVIRNAGGLVTTDVLRSLELAQRRMGTRDVVVIHHTDCAGVAEREAGRPADEVLRHALNVVLDAPDLSHDGTVRGFVLDVDRDTLREVSAFWSAPTRAKAGRDGASGRARTRCAACGRPFDQPGSVWRPHRPFCSDVCRRSPRGESARDR